MSIVSKYDEKEWELLRSAPFEIATLVVLSDFGSVLDFYKLFVGLNKEGSQELRAIRPLLKPRADLPPDSLLEALLYDISLDPPRKIKFEPTWKDDETLIQSFTRESLAYLSRVSTILKDKATPEDSAMIKQWLLDMAKNVAQAVEEGGGVRVS